MSLSIKKGDNVLVIANTNKKRQLADSKYNERRAECDKVLEIINANGHNYKYLCDITEEELDTLMPLIEDEKLQRRFRHVVSENVRTIKASKALKDDVISSDVANTIKEYMGYLVSNNIYRWPAFEGTNAGGKTGTADYMLEDGSEGVPHGWFISVAPLDNPEIAVAVIVEEGENGAGSAANIASQVVRTAVLGQ